MASPLLGPIIIGAVGTAIATIFQNNSARIEADRQLRQAEQSVAKELFKDTAGLTDRLTFHLTEALSEVKRGINGDGGGDDATWQEYHTARGRWMSLKSQALAGTRLYFGPLSEKRLSELYVQTDRLDKSLRDLRDDYDSGRDEEKVKQFEITLEETKELNRLLNERLLALLQAGQVGVFRDTSRDEEEATVDLFDTSLQTVPLVSAGGRGQD